MNECLANSQADPSAMSQCQRDYDAAVALVPAVGEKFQPMIGRKVKSLSSLTSIRTVISIQWATVKVGQYIDMVNEDGTGFMLGVINRVAAGMWYENPVVWYNVVKSSQVMHRVKFELGFSL